jgi:hypothetical protein
VGLVVTEIPKTPKIRDVNYGFNPYLKVKTPKIKDFDPLKGVRFRMYVFRF